jgi:predicted esterase
MRRLRPALLLLLAAILLAGPEARAKDAPAAAAPATWNGRDRAREVKAWIKEYFAAPAERRAAIREALDGLGALRLRDVKRQARAILKVARKQGPRLTKKNVQEFAYDGLKGTVHVLGAKKRRPLFVALHGGGQGVGDGKNALQKWSLAARECIVLAPTTPQKVGSAWNQPRIERWVLALIEAAVRTWDVDTNRIYLAGHSMGGYGTWSIGGRHADRFAALAACAGGLFMMGRESVAPGIVPNLLNTPIWFYNSTDDKQVHYRSAHLADAMLRTLEAEGYPYDWKYDEYTDIGHGLPPKGLKPIVDWMLEHERQPQPRHVVWEPGRAPRARFAWLGRAGGAGRLEARIEGNVVTLRGRGPVDLYLNPALLDLEQPVTVRRDAQTLFEGLVPARLSVLLRSIAEECDEQRWYCALVTVR